MILACGNDIQFILEELSLRRELLGNRNGRKLAQTVLDGTQRDNDIKMHLGSSGGITLGDGQVKQGMIVDRWH